MKIKNVPIHFVNKKPWMLAYRWWKPKKYSPGVNTYVLFYGTRRVFAVRTYGHGMMPDGYGYDNYVYRRKKIATKKMDEMIAEFNNIKAIKLKKIANINKKEIQHEI